MARTSNTSQKIAVSLPRSILQRLRKQVPARQRDEFIAQALDDRLALAEQFSALDESAGSWKDEDHPEMQAPEDVERWLAALS